MYGAIEVAVVAETCSGGTCVQLEDYEMTWGAEVFGRCATPPLGLVTVRSLSVRFPCFVESAKASKTRPVPRVNQDRNAATVRELTCK